MKNGDCDVAFEEMEFAGPFRQEYLVKSVQDRPRTPPYRTAHYGVELTVEDCGREECSSRRLASDQGQQKRPRHRLR